MKSTAFWLCALIITTSARAEFVSLAYDTASNYTGWNSGTNGGAGLDNWVFRTSGTTDGHKGGFLASTGGNSELEHVWSVPGFHAWGTYANGGSEAQNFVAFRGFGWNDVTWANKLDMPLDTFRLSMENGAVDSIEPGLVGFALRNNNIDATTGDYGANRRFEFGFKGGETNYYMIDASGTVNTGLPWRDTGFHLEFMLGTNDTYSFTIVDALTESATNFTGTLTGSGSIDSVAMFNRDSRSNSDVYFNKMAILEFREPTVLTIK